MSELSDRCQCPRCRPPEKRVSDSSLCAGSVPIEKIIGKLGHEIELIRESLPTARSGSFRQQRLESAEETLTGMLDWVKAPNDSHQPLGAETLKQNPACTK